LKLVIVSGSFAAEKNRADSDLDIAVLGSKDLSFDTQINLINEPFCVYKKNIDLTILNNANPLLLFEAGKNPILLYGNHEELAKLKLRAFKAYHDYAPYFKMERDLNKKIIAAYACQ